MNNATTAAEPTMNTKRINLWDFDDVLAHSYAAVAALKASRPEVPGFAWWHDEALSTEAALMTEALDAGWALLEATPGEHWILTARNGAAVEAWLAKHNRRGHFAQVVSTSHKVTANIPASEKKTWTVALAVSLADEVHFYDDTMANLEAAKRVNPSVNIHHV